MTASSSAAATRPGLRRLARWAGRLWFLEDELGLLPDLVPAGAICLDIGANRGAYMTALALLAGPDGRVVAVEPQQGPLRTARFLRRLLRLPNVTLCHLGVSDVAGELTLIVPHRYGLPVYGRSFLADAPELSDEDFAEFSGARRRGVRVTTVDALVRDQELVRVDLIKCDIEGAELRMLRGAEHTIAEHRPTLLLEIEDRHVRKYGHSAADVFEWLRERGYRAHVHDRKALVEVDGVTPAFRNYVFLSG